MESDPVGLRGGVNSYLYATASPVHYIDALGLWVKRCARGLGGKNKPPKTPGGWDLLRHDYLSVSGAILSFQAGPNGVKDMISSQGRIDDINEYPSNPKCKMICADNKLDKYVKAAASVVGAPYYCVWAYPGSAAYRGGSRNCQTWVDDVLNKAKQEYIKNVKCQSCFP